MTARSSRGAAATATLVALAAVPLAPAGPAAAASGRCAPGTGVTVVLDYGPIGGGVVIGCDPDGAGRPAAQVVEAAGFDLDYVSSQPGFVCRVEGRPSQDEGEDCGDTPPGNAYWGLFWSDADPASWVYSSEGVGSLDVPEGGSIGWRFQDGGDRENPSAPPNPEKKTPSPQPTKNPSPQPSKPPKAADPTPTPTPSASAPPGTEGSSPAPEAAPGGQKERRPGTAGSRDGDQGGKGTGSDKGKGDKSKADKGENGKNGKNGKDGKGRNAEKDAEAGLEEDVDTTTDAAIEPASDEPLTDDGSSTVLTLVAGGAVLLLVGAAGVIAWRRRV